MNNKHPAVWIIISLLITLLITLFPLPYRITLMQPSWLFVVLLFWIINAPEYCGIGVAWGVGLLADCVTGSWIGLHAFVFTVVAYGVLKWPASIMRLPMWQQMNIILLFSVLNLFLQRSLLSMGGEAVPSKITWFSVLTTALVWPMITAILKHAEKQSIIYHRASQR